MSPLRQALADYLAVRRALGYKLAYAEKLLGQFVSYLEDTGADTITTAGAVAWAVLPGGSPCWHAQRLTVVRGFAAHLHATDPAAEIPPPHLIPARPPRATPYLYTDAEVSALMAATATLNSPLRAATYQTLIGLLAATGMRVGEAIRLDRPDFDPGAGVLTVRDTNFGKTRLVPLHPTVTAALAGYLRLRDELHPGPGSPAVFISPAGTRLAYCNVHATWRLLVRRAGLRPRSPHCRPRPHDLRH
jgi:integrase